MNILFDICDGIKPAKTIMIDCEGESGDIELTENDMVFYTNGSNVESLTYGSQTESTGMDCEIHEGGSFSLRKK